MITPSRIAFGVILCSAHVPTHSRHHQAEFRGQDRPFRKMYIRLITRHRSPHHSPGRPFITSKPFFFALLSHLPMQNLLKAALCERPRRHFGTSSCSAWVDPRDKRHHNRTTSNDLSPHMSRTCKRMESHDKLACTQQAVSSCTAVIYLMSFMLCAISYVRDTYATSCNWVRIQPFLNL